MKTKVRKTPLLPTSRITHFIFPNSDHPLRNITSQALCPCLYLFPTTARDKQQCPTTGRRGHLPPLYEQPESWAGGQIPLNCLFFLSSTPRAGLRQNSRKTSRVPILPGHLHCLLCPASSKTAAFCWAPPHQQPWRRSAAQATPLFGKDEDTATPVPLLA